ncbi:MAG: NfeD family protein [Halobacteriales archaeon]|nr:NfeD family protein [Halobacteriales archaeon]
MVENLIDDIISRLDLSLWFALVGFFVLFGEAFIPGGALMVVGTGLLAAGATGLLFGINSLLPLTVLTAVYGTIAFAGFKHIDVYGERGEQTSGADSLRGDLGVVKETVTADDGRVKLKSGGFDPFYLARSASGKTIPEGTTVRVVNPRGGNVLEVEPVDEAGGVGDTEEATAGDVGDETPPDK